MAQSDSIDISTLLADTLAKAKAVSAASAIATDEIAAREGLMNDVIKSGSTAADAAAVTKAEQVQLEGNLRIQQDAEIQRRLAMLGASPSVDSYVNVLNTRITGDTEQIRQMHTEYQKKLQEDHTLDPIGWLVAQFELPGDATALNAKVAMREADIRRRDELIATSSQLHTLWKDADSKTSQLIVDTAAKNVLSVEQAKAAELKLRMQQQGIQATSAKLAVSVQDLQVTHVAFDTQMKMQQYILQQNADARAAVSSALENEMKSLQIEAFKEDKASQQILIDRINAVRTQFGQAATNWATFKTEPAAVKEKWTQLASDYSIVGGAMGANPVDAVLNNMNKLGVYSLPSGAPQLIVNEVNRAKADAMAAFQKSGQHPKPEELQAETTKRFMQKLQTESTNIPEKGGILSPAPFATFYAIPALQNGVIMQSMKAAAQNPEIPLKLQNFVDQADHLIKAGKISSYDAANEISRVFKTAAEETARDKWYQRFNIPLAYGKQFNQVIQINPLAPPGFGDSTAVDGANPVAVWNALERRRVSEQRASIFFGMGATALSGGK